MRWLSIVLKKMLGIIAESAELLLLQANVLVHTKWVYDLCYILEMWMVERQGCKYILAPAQQWSRLYVIWKENYLHAIKVPNWWWNNLPFHNSNIKSRLISSSCVHRRRRRSRRNRRTRHMDGATHYSIHVHIICGLVSSQAHMFTFLWTTLLWNAFTLARLISDFITQSDIKACME